MSAWRRRWPVLEASIVEGSDTTEKKWLPKKGMQCDTQLSRDESGLRPDEKVESFCGLSH
jgi:hypothetical protein